MTRIVAGQLGGRRLAVPAGRGTRPTSDRVREALFNSLGGLLELAGGRVADLYAGSGAIGFEALSRGCRHALLVESDPKAVTILRRNIAVLGVAAAVDLVAAPVRRVLADGPDQPYDLIFADPPYDLPAGELNGVLLVAAQRGWLAPDGLLVVERATRSGPPAWPPGLAALRHRRYGETTLWYGHPT